jgi:hypothetical protein
LNGGLQAIADEVGLEVSGKPWMLNKALVSDYFDTCNHHRDWSDEEMMGTSPDSEIVIKNGWEDFEAALNMHTLLDNKEMKWRIIQNVMKQLKGMKVDVYFFDDLR